MTRNRKNSDTNFSKILTFIAIIGIIVLLIVALSSCGKGYDESLAGSIETIDYNVNVCKTPAGKTIAQLERGTYVILTGNTHEFFGGDDHNGMDNWIEIQLEDGTVGWIVSRAV